MAQGVQQKWQQFECWEDSVSPAYREAVGQLGKDNEGSGSRVQGKWCSSSV